MSKKQRRVLWSMAPERATWMKFRAPFRALYRKDLGRVLLHCLTQAALIITLLCIVGWPAPALAVGDIQYTQGVADRTLRSDLNVDPSTLGMRLRIPLGSYPGRGDAGLPVTLMWSSKLWRISYLMSGSQFDAYSTWVEPLYAESSSQVGWTSSLDVPLILTPGWFQQYTAGGQPTNCSGPIGYPCYYVKRVGVRLPDGSLHELRQNSPIYNCPRGSTCDFSGTYYAVDGSQLRYETATSTLYLPDGSRYLIGNPTTQYIDRNGNTLSYNSTTRQWTDALGRVLNVPLSSNPTVGDAPYTLPGVGGSTITYTFRWRNLADVRTDASQPLRYPGDCTDPNFPGTRTPALFSSLGGSMCAQTLDNTQLFNPVVLYQIVLPTGGTYTFTYNAWGEIDKVVLPTGGYERYNYGSIQASGWLRTDYEQGNRGVLDRWESSDGTSTSEVHWTYAAGYADIYHTQPYTVAITAPDGSYTKRTLYSATTGKPPWGFDDVRVGMAYEERAYSATNQMLRRKLTDWLASSDSSYANARDPRVTKEVNNVLDTGGNALTATTTYGYDADFNRTSTSLYDFASVDQTTAQTGASSSMPLGGLVRTDEATYLVNDPAIDSGTRSNYRARNLLALPTSTRAKDGNGIIIAQNSMSYDESAYPLLTYGPITGWTDPATTVRGNVTTVGRWLNTTATYLQTHVQYDQCGSLRNSWDANGNQSQIDYSITYAYAYPTLTRAPVPDPSGQRGSATALVSTSIYDFNTGLVTSTTDANNQTASIAYNDSLNRPTTVTQPTGGGSTNYAYGDTPGNVYVRTQTAQDVSRVIETYQYFDGLGRPNRTFLNETGTYVTGDTQYDNLGRVWRVSNPYRTTNLTDPVNPSGLWTTNAYDALGRTLTVTTPDNAVVTTSYSGNTVTVTDQAAKARKSVMDALGRLTNLYEDPSGLNYQTSYSYDVLGDLTNVSQGVQTRTFVYDSLKRLTSATNPESGNITYQYDSNGNLTQKTDARPVTTNVAYDALNRAKSKTYNDGTPPVDYYYDSSAMPSGAPVFDRGFAFGRLVAVTYGGASAGTYRGYDTMGRVIRQYQQTDSVNYLVEASYYANSSLQNETYPSVPGYSDRRTVSYANDGAGRLSSLSSVATSYAPGASVTSIGYAPHSALSSETYGNSLVHAITYNNRLQQNEIKLGTSGAPTSVLDLIYNYGTTSNNGNLQSIAYSGGGLSYTQSFGYDALNRLTTSNENSGSSWSQTNAYDRYGNRQIDYGGGVYNLAFSSSTNRITTSGFSYDSAGNLTNDTIHAYTFDAENKIRKVDNVSAYVYDGEDQRVRKLVGENTRFVYGIGGQLLAEFDGSSGNLKKEYVKGGATLITIEPSALNSNGTRYPTSDHLGSPRVVTNSSAGVVSRHDFMPFGEELGATVGGRTTGMGFSVTDGLRQKFTLKERDIETGLDYFEARYYSSTQGRFTSPDEFTGGPDELYTFVDDASENPTFYADLRKPQSLNKYQYSFNNPLRYVDPDGHDPEEPEPPQDPKPVIPVPVPVGPGGIPIPVPVNIGPAPKGPTDQQIIRGVESVLDTVCDYTGITKLADWLRPKIMPGPAQPTTATPPSPRVQPVPPPPITMGKGSTRDVRKINPGTEAAAKKGVEDARAKVKDLRSRPHKDRDPSINEQLSKAERELRKALDRLRKSETHGRRHKGT